MATNPEPIQQREPARLVGALIALAGAIFVALPMVGVTVDPGLPVAVERIIYAGAAVVAIVAPFVQAELTRRRVYSPATHEREVAQARTDRAMAHVRAQELGQRQIRRTPFDPAGSGRPQL